MKYKLLILLSVVVLSTSLFYVNQSANGTTFSTTSGKVTNSTGAGIIVKAELVQGNVVYHISSDSTGNYNFTVPNGIYTLKFSDYNQTIPNAPAYYDVEKTVTISSSTTVNLTIPSNTWTGSGLRDNTNALYNGYIQIHAPLNVAGYSGMSGDYVKVINGAFTFKLLPTPSSFTPLIAGDSLGANTCTATVPSKTITC